jgi:hypothetical protein
MPRHCGRSDCVRRARVAGHGARHENPPRDATGAPESGSRSAVLLIGRSDMLKEFKEFAMRGNVLDMAIGIIIGAAFGKIVSSFVADIVMPPVGMLMGQVDFSQLFIALNGQHYDTLAAAKEAGVGDAELRPLREHDPRFPHRRLRRVPPREGGELREAQAGGGTGRADDEEVPALPVRDPDRRHALRLLHDRRLTAAQPTARRKRGTRMREANVFAGIYLDRCTQRRKDSDWLRSTLRASTTRFVALCATSTSRRGMTRRAPCSSPDAWRAPCSGARKMPCSSASSARRPASRSKSAPRPTRRTC